MKFKIILLASLLLSEFFIENKCDIFKKLDKERQNCTFILSNGGYKDFLKAIQLFKNCTREFSKPSLVLKLSNYVLPAFPNETFTDLPHLRVFELIIDNGSQIQLLSPMLPNYFVFENMKFDKAKIDISNSASIIGWKWKALLNLSYSQIRHFEFNARRTKLIHLSSDFGKIANGRLTVVRIHNCQLKWLGKNVFGPLSNLIILELKKNFIENFERFHLPYNTTQLKVIDLGDNKLQHISMDVFLDLNLEYLYLNGNNIKILSSEMERFMRLGVLQIHGVTWPCNCRNILKLLEKWQDFFSGEICYMNTKLTEINEFVKSCEPRKLT